MTLYSSHRMMMLMVFFWGKNIYTQRNTEMNMNISNCLQLVSMNVLQYSLDNYFVQY
ncbi:unnamed protein product [Chironomus riparius]|uniref:Uncharacterized protein n=1 Tax=Chironomus riparius TaxID=315576 RepID=A0A9N9WUD6_9DIPT|nr:unnamed protein product [Chironomus riparius]